MPEHVTSVRVFISSPGDVFPERDVVKRVVQELDRSPHYLYRYKLIPYAYEDSAPALAGAEAQVVVDKYLLRPEEADIFVGMLWLRMGTPTKDLINPETGAPYQSGTEYELLAAYRASQERGWPARCVWERTSWTKSRASSRTSCSGGLDRCLSCTMYRMMASRGSYWRHRH